MTAQEHLEHRMGHCPHCDKTVEKIEVGDGVLVYPPEHMHNPNKGFNKDRAPGRSKRVDS